MEARKNFDFTLLKRLLTDFSFVVSFINPFSSKYFQSISFVTAPTNKNIFLRDIIDDNSVSEELLLKQKNPIIKIPGDPTPQNAQIKIGFIKHRMRPVSQLIYHSNGHAVTLLTKKTSMPYYLINNTIRRLSLLECKKLMGFSKDHITSPEYFGYKQVGNAVIPQMIEHVYDSIQPKKRRTLF